MHLVIVNLKIYIPPNVRIIKDFAFNSFSNYNLKSIVIEKNSNLIRIDNCAFSHSTEKLTFSSSLDTESNFWNMENLTEINIPKNENFQFKYDGGLLFEKTNFTNDNYDKLFFVPYFIKKVTIPSNVRIIAMGSLCYSEIEEIFIPSSVVKIEPLGFGSIKLKKVVFDVNTKFISIDGFAFNCTNIKSISLPSGEIDFKPYWCHETNKLTEIKVPESNDQLKFENGILYGKTDKKSDNFDLLIFASRDIEIVNIPSSVKMILTCAFYGCRKIKEFNIPKNSQLSSIKKSAFAFSSAESISIPDSVSEIQNNAFYKCKIKFINFNEESKLQSISRYSFTLSSIKTIKIPKHVKEIERGAFVNCRKLRTIEISENSELHSIYDGVFNSSSIESFLIPSHVTFIENNAFTECNKLKIVEIAELTELKSLDASIFLIKSLEILLVPAKLKIFIKV